MVSRRQIGMLANNRQAAWRIYAKNKDSVLNVKALLVAFNKENWECPIWGLLGDYENFADLRFQL